MNKNIEKLLLEVVNMEGEDGDLMPSLHTPEQIEKFATLIIKRCALIAWRNTPDYEDLDYGHKISNCIKDHFEVSEQ